MKWRQKDCMGQTVHFGDRAVQTSRPKSTMRWQKSDCSAGGMSGERMRSARTGSYSSSG